MDENKTIKVKASTSKLPLLIKKNCLFDLWSRRVWYFFQTNNWTCYLVQCSFYIKISKFKSKDLYTYLIK